MQDGSTREIIALEQKRYDAMKSADAEALGHLLADDLVYTHSDGSTDDRTSYIERVRSGHFVYHQIVHHIDRVIAGTDIAVAIGSMKAEVNVAGEARSLDNASLSVWVRREQGWRFAAYQPTPRR